MWRRCSSTIPRSSWLTVSLVPSSSSTAIAPARRLPLHHKLPETPADGFVPQRLWFSSAAASNDAKKSQSFSWKKLIQPFVMKCHPDRAAQLGLPKTAVQVNLKAIQNLNAYVNGIQQLEKGGRYPFSEDNTLVEVEFVMAFEVGSGHDNTTTVSSTSTSKAAAQPTTSRRKVELQVPGPHLSVPRMQSHVQKQVVKLLRMADLPVPKLHYPEDEWSEEYEYDPNQDEVLDEEYLAHQVLRRHGQKRESHKTAWDRSRDRFLRRINWKKFDKVYAQAMKDAQANLETKGMIRNHPQRRKEFLATILSHIQFTAAVLPLERLVAYRRLLRLLDEEFDYLELENFGRYWEDLRIVVTESRPYNTSSSAMRKRRLRHQETGYRFTIHYDNSVTLQIPVDFRTDELTQELHRNVRDFYAWTQQDDEGGLGLGAILDDEV